MYRYLPARLINPDTENADLLLPEIIDLLVFSLKVARFDMIQMLCGLSIGMLLLGCHAYRPHPAVYTLCLIFVVSSLLAPLWSVTVLQQGFVITLMAIKPCMHQLRN